MGRNRAGAELNDSSSAWYASRVMGLQPQPPLADDESSVSAAHAGEEPGGLAKTLLIETEDWTCRLNSAFEPVDAVREIERASDPGTALQTIHWGRNYLYATIWDSRDGSLDIIVKQFKNQGFLRRVDRRFRGSKARRSWRAARAILASGLSTPEPVALIESQRPDGPSFYVSRRLPASVEVRHFFRRRNGGLKADDFPAVDPAGFLRALGGLARHLHDRGIWYRDFSIGNILAEKRQGNDELDFHLVDTNRARQVGSLGLWRRCRDICRLPVLRREDREAFMEGYWGEIPARHSLRWLLWVGSMQAYLLKHSVRNRLKKRVKVRGGKHGGRHHPHIPPAQDGASARDKTVWDRLSDQPHQHAGRMEKVAIRAADLPSHLRDLGVLAGSLPRVWRQYRRLQSMRDGWRTPLDGIGLCVRPFVQDLEAQLAAIDELGVRNLLLRLHPWERDHDAEVELARQLFDRGCDLMFALPQNRDLVRDGERWKAAVEEISERFAPYGSRFQVGQAPNRSKWGMWTHKEFIKLYVEASKILRRRSGVEVMGPAVIDFEPHATIALVNRRHPGLHFDVVSNLLYVDRRGAPEKTQFGFDAADKALFLRAIAETGRSCGPRSWITEVNWPLWEGPHSPAGKTVSVDEETQADYLPRYYLLAMCSGGVERVYWWRLIARGYGLISATADGVLRHRPSFTALQTLIRQTAGSVCMGAVTRQDGVFVCRLSRDGVESIAAWTLDGEGEFELPRTVVEVVERDGTLTALPNGRVATVSPSIRYFRMASV